jgi:hypothetical protein
VTDRIHRADADEGPTRAPVPEGSTSAPVPERQTGAPRPVARASASFSRPSSDRSTTSFRRPSVALSERGFVLTYASERKDAFGNTVFLDLYVGPTVRSPSGERLGRVTLSFNAVRVDGLAARVDDDLDELIKLDRVVDPTAALEVEEVEVKGRPGLLVRQGVGRSVVTTGGDWRVQVSTGAPSAWLSDASLVEITSRAEVR